MADDFQGFARLAALLEGYVERSSPANILKAHAAGAEYFVGVMRSRGSPRGRSSPHMLDTITYEQDSAKTETVVGWGKFYGRLVESGHRAGGFAKKKMAKKSTVPGRPHMRPEFNSQREEIINRMVAVLKGN